MRTLLSGIAQRRRLLLLVVISLGVLPFASGASELTKPSRYQMLAAAVSQRINTKTESPFDRALQVRCATAVADDARQRIGEAIPETVLRVKGHVLIREAVQAAIASTTQSESTNAACGRLLSYMRACEPESFTGLIGLAGWAKVEDHLDLLSESDIACPGLESEGD